MIDTATAEKLLYLSIALIIAAIAGGGLDAVGVIRVPTLRNWKTQAGVAAVGAIVMTLAVVGLVQAGDAEVSSAWDANMSKLAQGTVGIPPPALKPDFIRYDLVMLLNSAGDDPNKNCSVAAFLVEFSDRLDYIPPGVKARMLHPTATKSDVCYQESLSIAQTLQTKASQKEKQQPSPLGQLEGFAPLLAALDTRKALGMLLPFESSDVRVAMNSAARLLESVTAVGDEGYMYLGQRGGDGLRGDRSIEETTIAVGQTATVQVLVNLRAVGTDSDYRNHTVYRVLSPGTRITIQSLTGGQYEWARVRVASLPSI